MLARLVSVLVALALVVAFVNAARAYPISFMTRIYSNVYFHSGSGKRRRFRETRP
jgi:hypothetical protein